MSTSSLEHTASPRWVEALNQLPHDAFHLPGYAAVDAGRLGGTGYAFVHSSGPDVVLVPVVVRDVGHTGLRDAVSPYGYAGPIATSSDPQLWREALTAMQQVLLEAGVISCLLRLHPLLDDVTDRLGEFGTVVRHGETVTMDLTLPEEDLVAGMRANHRRDIRRGRREGLQTVVDDWTYLDEFLDMYAETMRRVGASSDYFFERSYVPNLLRAMRGAVHLVMVLDGGRPIGGGTFFETGGIASYHLGGSHTDALAHQPSKLMIDAAWRWAKERGNRTLHLGGGLGGSATDSLFHFKTGFSSARHEFATARLVLDESAYAGLCGPGRSLDRTGFFPAYRAVSGPPPNGLESEQQGETAWMSIAR